MEDIEVYTSYARYAKLIGSNVLSFEEWSRTRYKLASKEAREIREREKWLADEADVKMTPPTRQVKVFAQHGARRGSQDASH